MIKVLGSIILLLALLFASVFTIPLEVKAQEQWVVGLDIGCDLGVNTVKFGVAPDATAAIDPFYDIIAPPLPMAPVLPGAGYQQACFFYSELSPFQRLITSYVASGTTMSWPLRIDYNCSQPSEITITWYQTDIANAPAKYHLFFKAGEQVFNMRGVQSYEFSASTGTYNFEIIATIDTTEPSVPGLLFPTDESSTDDATPTFDWDDVTDPSGISYSLQVDNDTDFTSPLFNLVGLVNSTYTPISAIPDNSYYWRVKAVDGATNESSWTDAWLFHLNAIAPAVDIIPLTPDPTTDADPTFFGNASDNSGPIFSVEYRVLADDGVTVEIDWIAAEAVDDAFDGDNEQYTFTTSPLSDGVHTVEVKATDIDGNTTAPENYATDTFSVDTILPEVPALVSPANGTPTTDATPTFDWDNVPDPSGVFYSLQVDNDTDFTSPLFNLVGLINSTYTPISAIPDNSYYWRVKAVDGAANESSWTGTWSFTVDSTLPSVPVSLSPVSGSISSDNTPTIDWSDVTDPSGVTYSLQVDNNSNFSSPEINETGLSDSTYTPTSSLLDNTYHWRVKSIDGLGNESGWSESRVIIVDTTSPSVPGLLFPANGSSTNDTTPTLDWLDVTDPSGITYSLQVDGNSDFNSPVINETELTGSTYTTSALSLDTYYWRVCAVDGVGNSSSWSGSWSLTIAVLADTTSPVISDVAATVLTATTTFISWNTDELATSQVEYGLNTTYDFSSSLDSNYLSSHGIPLNGLSPATTYHFRVISIDNAGNEAVSGDYTFTTLADITPPTLSEILVDDGSITMSSVIIYWVTSEPATTQVEYGVTTSYGSFTPLNDSLRLVHGVALVGLTPDTGYHFRVRSADAAGNEVISGDFTFNTTTDSDPPVISEVSTALVVTTAAIIMWVTDEPANSTIEYGLTSSYGLTISVPDYVIFHGIVLGGLDSNVQYHYCVKSADEYGNESISGDYVFTTVDNTAPVISEAGEMATTSTGTVITWTTGEEATSQVEYGTSSGVYTELSPLDSDYILSHSVVLDGLNPDTTYYYRVISMDASDNEAVSNEYMFTTLLT